MEERFDKFVSTVVRILRHPYTFAFYMICFVVWLAVGFFVGFGNPTWHAAMVSPVTALTFIYLPLVLWSQDKQAATIIAYQKQTAEDLEDVNDRQAEARVKDEM